MKLFLMNKSSILPFFEGLSSMFFKVFKFMTYFVMLNALTVPRYIISLDHDTNCI